MVFYTATYEYIGVYVDTIGELHGALGFRLYNYLDLWGVGWVLPPTQ